MATPNLSTQQLVQATSIEIAQYWDRNYQKAWAQLGDDFLKLMRRMETKNDNLHIIVDAEQHRIRFSPIGTPLSSQPVLKKQFRVPLIKVIPDGVSIPITSFQDRIAGPIVQREVQGMMAALVRASKLRIIESLNAGDSDPFWTTWDGAQFFDTSHAVGASGVTWGNLEPGDSLPSADLTVENIFLLISKLNLVPSGPDGLPFPLPNPTYYIIVPPQMHQQALEVSANVWSPVSGRFTENVAATQLKGMLNVIMEPQLGLSPDGADATWYFAVTTPESVPWLSMYQTGGGSGELIPLIEPWMTNVKDDDMYVWEAKSIEETFPIRFEQVVKVVG
jgi:hypothetical protein